MNDDTTVTGGDGHATHAACDPDTATADLADGDPGICWICGEPADSR